MKATKDKLNAGIGNYRKELTQPFTVKAYLQDTDGWNREHAPQGEMS